MGDLERQVWATAFAAEWSQEREFRRKHGGDQGDISAFSCAEQADEAVEKFRDAMGGNDAKLLIPVKEGWVEGRRGSVVEDALTEARDAMCKWCASGTPLDGDSHTPPLDQLPRFHGSAPCDATPIRKLLEEEQWNV